MAKSVATVKEAPLPAFMQEHVGLGTEKVGAGDVEVPRVKLMQALSPELQEYNELKAGNFFHTLAEQAFGNSVRITPIYVDQRFILWRPRSSGGGILARADDGVHWEPATGAYAVKLKSGAEVTWRTARTVSESGLDKWGSENPADPNSPPAATRMYNIVVTFPDMPDMPPAVVTLQRASIKVARRFIGKLKITRAPSFGLIFDMGSFQDVNNGGEKFFNFTFKAAGMVQDKDDYERNFEYYKYFEAQGVKVKDLEGAQEEDVPNSDGTGPAF